MNAGFKIEGMEGLLKAVTEAYSGTKAVRMQMEALNAGGDVVVEQMKKNFESFKDTGYSQDEIMRTDASTRENTTKLKIGWEGEHGRWRLVHLNEFGYNRMGRQYTPKGFGTIGKSITESRDDFEEAVAGRLRKNL